MLTPAPISRSRLAKKNYIALPDRNWYAAINDEYNALIETGIWNLVPRTAGVNIIISKLYAIFLT